MSKEISYAALFKALGDPTRLQIFELLRSCGTSVSVDPDGAVRPVHGPTVGEVCCTITGAVQITSNVSRHLRELELAGLIVIEQRGKHRFCRINPETLALLGSYFGGEPRC